MPTERSGFAYFGLVILVFALLLLLLRACFTEELERNEETQRKRREFEEKQLKPSNFKNPNFFPRYKHPLSSVTKPADNQWQVFLTPHTVDFDNFKRTRSEAFRLGLEKFGGDYAAYTNSQDNGWVSLQRPNRYDPHVELKPDHFYSLESDNGLKFYYCLYTQMHWTKPVYCGSRCQTYLWGDCKPGYTYCLGSNPVSDVMIRVSEDSPVVSGYVTITKKPLPNYN